MTTYTLFIEKNENIRRPKVLEFATGKDYDIQRDELHVNGVETSILTKNVEAFELDNNEETTKEVIDRILFSKDNDAPVQYSKENNTIEFELEEDFLKYLRNKRNKLLDKSDIDSGILWSDLWESRTAEQQEAWKLYRQSLRDIMSTENPERIVWPEAPSNTVDSA